MLGSMCIFKMFSLKKSLSTENTLKISYLCMVVGLSLSWQHLKPWRCCWCAFRSLLDCLTVCLTVFLPACFCLLASLPAPPPMLLNHCTMALRPAPTTSTATPYCPWFSCIAAVLLCISVNTNAFLLYYPLILLSSLNCNGASSDNPNYTPLQSPLLNITLSRSVTYTKPHWEARDNSSPWYT